MTTFYKIGPQIFFSFLCGCVCKSCKIVIRNWQASSIECAPELGDYNFNGIALRLGLTGKHQLTNASLALQLCKTWIRNYQDNGNGSERRSKSNCTEDVQFDCVEKGEAKV